MPETDPRHYPDAAYQRFPPAVGHDRLSFQFSQQTGWPEESLRPPGEGFSSIDRSSVATWRRWGPVLAGAAVLVLLAWGGLVRFRESPSSETEEPHRTAAASRPFLGRLSSEAGEPAAGPAEGNARLRPTLRRETTRGARGPAATEAELHERALRYLRRSDLASGVSLLEELTATAPGDAAAWNDLGVVRLERAIKEDRPQDLVRALTAFERAVEIDPQSPQVAFNRALVLGELYLWGQAREAWRSYLELDPSSGWAEEARVRLREGEVPSLAELWQAEQPRLENAIGQGDAAEVQEIVRRFPHRSRIAVEEEALGQWGAAVGAGDNEEADHHLAFARAVGEALAQTTGDAMTSDAVAAIDRATAARDHDRVDELSRGHAAFGRGLALYREQEGDAALPWLEVSVRRLDDARSPFSGWARFYRSVCTHYSEVTETYEVFRRLEEATDSTRYPVLAGHGSWMMGTIANYLNRPEDALARLAVARDRLGSAGAAPESFGFVHVLFAETYDVLGEPDAGWRERLMGLAAAAKGGDWRRLHATLYEAAHAAARAGPQAALAFESELLASDLAWGNAGALVETYSLLGRTYAAARRHQAAAEAFTSAREHADAVGHGDQSEHIEMEVALAEGEALVEVDPEAAVVRLSEALNSARRRRFLGFDGRMLQARARARRVLGEVDAAEEDLLSALTGYEALRANLKDRNLRLSYFEGVQDTYDAMIRLQVEVRTSPAAAFEFAERARARLLLDMVEREPGSVDLPRPMAASEVASRLPTRVILVEYAVLPDRLVAWTIYRGNLEMRSLPWSAEELSRKVAALRSAMEHRAGDAEIRGAAGALYDALLAPVLEGVAPGVPLVVIPDRFLSHVPFRALVDSRRGRYLLEERPVAVAPSATLYVTARERAAEFDGNRTVLAVGDPAFDRAAHPSLPRLPYASEEAAEVAALYPGSDLLRDEAATPEALVQAAGVHRIIHLSGHALLDPDTPWNHRLVLAPGAAEGSLAARQIATLRLPETEVVVLSACRTLRAGTERESFHGLAAAFFAAGPPVVVSSLWEVDDRATRVLMVRFHQALRGGADPANALREAQLHLLRQEDPMLASPATWGAFEAFGGAIVE